MTIKEAILKSLAELIDPKGSAEITEHIIENKYCKFDSYTPHATVSALCDDFIRKGDARIKRIKERGIYLYYFSKNEQSIEINKFTDVETKRGKNEKTFEERDLHKLLSTYLKSINIYSKTIYHEQSNRKDDNQIWTHPDMVGIRFLNLKTKISQDFLRTINQVDTFKINSYELKKEINNDSELRKAYFQAVSNSSWANYGYLVAFEISDSLTEEIERLNQSFGIGVILLNANPYQSRILFQAKYYTLDFKTIDKLCKINKKFDEFIEKTEKLLTAEDRYYKAIERELNEFCDDCFENDTEIEKYCKDKHIPVDENEFPECIYRTTK
jgi:hypothetical protein